MLFHNWKYLPAQLIGCLKISKIFKRNYTFLILKFKFNFTFVRCLSKVGKKMKIKTFFCKPAINLARQANYWKSYFFSLYFIFFASTVSRVSTSHVFVSIRSICNQLHTFFKPIQIFQKKKWFRGIVSFHPKTIF